MTKPLPTQNMVPERPDSASPDDLLELLLQAANFEQRGQLVEARQVYETLIELDGEGTYGLSAQKAIAALPTALGQSAMVGMAVATPKPAAQPEALTAEPIPLYPRYRFQVPPQLRQRWGNLNFGTKALILLTTASVIPVLVVTQVLVGLTQNSAQREFQNNLVSDVDTLESSYVLSARDESLAQAENLANLVAASADRINLANPKPPLTQQYDLRTFVREATSAGDRIRPALTKNFRIITDENGVTVAQTAKFHVDPTLDKTGFPLLPESKREVTPREFRSVETPIGAYFNQLPIVQTVLDTGKPAVGVELIPWELLERLGVGSQAAVGARTQPKSQPPINLDNYQAGLVSMAVYPIEVNTRIVGTAIVGMLLNRHHALVDDFSNLFSAGGVFPYVSIYAYDWRVNTTVPFTDNQTRAVGTFASPKAVEMVLKQRKDFTAKERIGNINYRVLYRPLYDHQKLTNPEAQPIGMISVARSQRELEQLLLQQQLLGLAIGGGVLLLVGLVAIPAANSVAVSLRNLARFAQRVGKGETDTRLEKTERTDEVGILARELNDMAGNIGTNMTRIQQQEQQRRLEAEQQRQEKERLQRGVVDLLLQIEGARRGDLTVQAPVSSGEVGSIADAFNATISSLRQIVTQVKSVTSQVNQLAQRSEDSVAQLSNSALTQSSELSQALANVVELSQSVQQVAQSSQEAAAIARRAAKAAHLGDIAMDQTVVSIDKIRTAVGNTTKQAKRLAETSQEISQILAVVAWISDRANLLAFNASIEASRAGEQGQGFRQVADELRGLAQQVSDSAKDIEELVSNIQQETAEVLNGMEVGTAEVVTGTQFVGETKQILQGLTDLSTQIDIYLQDVAKNTSQQTQTSRQMNEKMEVVASIARSNAEEAQSVVSSLQVLVQQVEMLESSVAQFRLRVQDAEKGEEVLV